MAMLVICRQFIAAKATILDQLNEDAARLRKRILGLKAEMSCLTTGHAMDSIIKVTMIRGVFKHLACE